MNKAYLHQRAADLSKIHSPEWVEVCLYYAAGYPCTVSGDSVTVHMPKKRLKRTAKKESKFERREEQEAV